MRSRVRLGAVVGVLVTLFLVAGGEFRRVEYSFDSHVFVVLLFATVGAGVGALLVLLASLLVRQRYSDRTKTRLWILSAVALILIGLGSPRNGLLFLIVAGVILLAVFYRALP